MVSRDSEAQLRAGMWNQLKAAGGPLDVAPAFLRDLGIYGGAQGIWIDAARTATLTADRVGITVGLLHTGRHYADDLSTDSLLYHYPNTRRPGRDEYEVNATKHAAALHIPVFVITPGTRRTLRNVILGDVIGWDDGLEIFRVQFLDGTVPAGTDGSPIGGNRRTRKPPRRGDAHLPYKRADEESAATPRDPFTFDPDKIDRGLKGHARTQNLLFDWLGRAGIEATSPAGFPNYDIAWTYGNVRYVGEVKSLTRANESQQIRLGLGQVLDYALVLAAAESTPVVPVLVLEKAPRESRWAELCRQHGVLLVWPETFALLPVTSLPASSTEPTALASLPDAGIRQ